MATMHHLETTCPWCGFHATDQGGPDKCPGDGDAALCPVCLEPAVFIETPEGLTQRRATHEERLVIEADPDYQAMRAMLARLDRTGHIGDGPFEQHEAAGHRWGPDSR